MQKFFLSALALCLLAGNLMAQNTYRQAGDWIARGGLGITAPDGDGADVGGATLDVDDGYAATLTAATFLMVRVIR